MRGLVLGASLVVCLLAACGDEAAKQYSTYQLCFDDVIKQDKTNVETIVKCCIEHEIAGEPGPVCGNDESNCINYLTANLKQTDADITVKTEACGAYVAAKASE